MMSKYIWFPLFFNASTLTTIIFINYSSDLDNGQANLCITDPKNARTLPLEVFASKGIYCVPMIFLRDIVMKMDTKTDWKEYVIPEFKQYLDQ